MTEAVETRLNALVAKVAKVRRWMVALAILKVLALCLIFVSGYIGLYAWLDHRLNFGVLERIVAFALLLAGLALLLYKLANSLSGHVSYSRAANHIENGRSFNQQLVTAIEYYENRRDYPYSKTLAEQLVLQVDRDSAHFKFDSTVDKWKGYVFAAIILAGVAIACLYVRDNYVYFSLYLSRLVRPLATVEPLKATTLEPITKDLVAEPGLSSDDLPGPEAAVKTDEPPKFKLLSPDGDYLATNVASVPITFEVTDDFGLDSVEMCLEIPGQQPQKLRLQVPQRAKSQQLAQTLELEEHDLKVGDSILFYASATEVDTGLVTGPRTSSSEVYFIEIRPYWQSWRPKGGGGGGGPGGTSPVELLDILEYTRAILKKTWAIANKPDPTQQDRSRLEFINNDVSYCAEQLAVIRDDSEYGFDDRHMATLNEVIAHYERASEYLTRHDASSAIEPEKNAYRILRKFIIEREMELEPPQSSSGQPEQRPDSIKLQPTIGEPELPEYEKERIESELKNLQRKLDKLAQEQKNLKTDFVNFLEQQDEQAESGQKMQEARSSSPGSQKQDQDKAGKERQSKSSTSQTSENASDEGQSASQSQNASEGQSASQGQRPAESRSPSQGQGAGSDKSSSDGQRAGDDQGVEASQSFSQRNTGGKQGMAGAEAMLKMLQAKQRALRQKASQLQQDLQQLPQTSASTEAQERDNAKSHLSEAVAKMDEVHTKLTEARYQADMNQSRAAKAVELMESARSELDLADRALEGELTLSEQERIAKKAQEMAEQLSEDADALDESLTPIERQQMLARLQAAKRLLESMSEPQWSNVDKNQRSTSASAAHVFTRDAHSAAADAARKMARQFWSIAINAKKRRAPLMENEPSDVEFYELEKEFFEAAAKFNPETVQK